MTKQEKIVIESMARVGYKTMFDLSWDELSKTSIERALWLVVASSMLNELRRLWAVEPLIEEIDEETNTRTDKESQ